jgi:hypothetical protein
VVRTDPWRVDEAATRRQRQAIRDERQRLGQPVNSGAAGAPAHKRPARKPAAKRAPAAKSSRRTAGKAAVAKRKAPAARRAR